MRQEEMERTQCEQYLISSSSIMTGFPQEEGRKQPYFILFTVSFKQAIFPHRVILFASDHCWFAGLSKIELSFQKS